MIEIRYFPTAAITSISTGVLLCNFSNMHEAAEYLMGHSIWTYHFADDILCNEMKQTVTEQYPEMPLEIEGVTKDNYLQKVADLEAKFGKTIKIRKGSGLTAMLPTDGIPKHLKDKTIIMKT